MLGARAAAAFSDFEIGGIVLRRVGRSFFFSFNSSSSTVFFAVFLSGTCSFCGCSVGSTFDFEGLLERVARVADVSDFDAAVDDLSLDALTLVAFSFGFAAAFGVLLREARADARTALPGVVLISDCCCSWQMLARR